MDKRGGILSVLIILNLVYVAVEAGFGFWTGSLGLLSDAGHNLGDAFSLISLLLAFRMESSGKGGALVPLVLVLNAVVLLFSAGAVSSEAVSRLCNPGNVVLSGTIIIVTAGVGIAVNGVTAVILGSMAGKDRGIFRYMIADTLVSVAVVVSGLFVRLTGYSEADSYVSLAIVLVLLYTACDSLFRFFKTKQIVQ